MRKEVRTYQIQKFRAEQEEGKLRFSGYAAVFEELSEDLGGFREKIAPGAFAESIVKDDVRALFNHDSNFVLGRNKAGTLVLTEDKQGLYFETDAPDTQWARDLKVSVDRGDINQCSFGFIVQDDEWHREGGQDTRTLKRCQLFDVSVVTYPAYTGTSVRSAADVFREEQERTKKVEDAYLKIKLDLYGRMI